MSKRARKKINKLTRKEAQAEYDKLVSDGHYQMVRTKHLEKRLVRAN